MSLLLLFGGGDTAGAQFPGAAVRVVLEIAFATNPGVAEPAWVDVTAYLYGFEIRRGRQHELDRVEAGTMTVVLKNDDRRFDPTYTTGPYYPNVRPLNMIRLSAVYSGVTYRLFTGMVENWPQEWQKNLGKVQLTAVDGFKAFQLKQLNTSFAAQRSDVRIGAVLDAVGWPSSGRSLATGQSTFQAATALVGVAALDHIQAAVLSENGRGFMSGGGAFTFIDRHAPYASTASLATFGPDPGDLPYRDAVLELSDGRIWNETRVTRQNGTEQVAADTATSQKRYFPRTLARSGLLLDGDREAEQAAGFLLSNYKEPSLRVASLSALPLQDVALWPQALGRELGDRVTVKVRPGAATETISQQGFVEGIEHGAGPNGRWQVTWRLSAEGVAYSVGSPIILDDPSSAANALDTTGLLVY